MRLAMPSPTLSVVIPTFDRLDRIRRVLEALSRQDYSRDDYEIIVISDGSTDGTNEYLASLSETGEVRPIFQSNQGPAAARNRGVAAAQGTFIVFIDDDVVPVSHLLAEHERMHTENPRDVAVIGPLLTPKDFKLLPWVEWEQEMLVKQYEAMKRGDWKPTARQFYTGNASVRRELLVEVGGFDEGFRRAEDVEFAYRLADKGIDFVFSPAAVGFHYAERSYKSWSEAAYTYGRNDAVFSRDPKRNWLVPVIREEFGQRKLALQLLIRACLGRPNATALVQGCAAAVGRFSPTGFGRAIYSTLFGLRYYQGFVDEIGDPDFFV